MLKLFKTDSSNIHKLYDWKSWEMNPPTPPLTPDLQTMEKFGDMKQKLK